jgi:ribosomal protein S18 acetylase RimI-like enzyme
VRLDVAEFNEHAISFYHRFYFQVVATHEITTPVHSYPVHTLVARL